jgi:hypothetical protein
MADQLLLQAQAQALADVPSEDKLSQSHAFAHLEIQHGLNVHRARRPEVVAYAVQHYGVQVSGAGGPGSGGAKYLSRGEA